MAFHQRSPNTAVDATASRETKSWGFDALAVQTNPGDQIFRKLGKLLQSEEDRKACSVRDELQVAFSLRWVLRFLLIGASRTIAPSVPRFHVAKKRDRLPCDAGTSHWHRRHAFGLPIRPCADP